MVKHKIEKTFAEYIADAITKDYLIVCAITSYTQAKYQTRNLPFGLGKTTLGMEVGYLLNGGRVSDNFQNKSVWEKVHNAMVYDPYNAGALLEPSRIRLPWMLWDDVQATAPASQTVPMPIRMLANFISTERPEVALVMFTCPNLNSISAPLRKLVNFEVIISERGYYEVHKLSYYKNFNRPLQDNMHFDYVDEIPRNAPFPALPDFEQEWYNSWRIDRKKALYPSLMKKLRIYTDLRQWDANAKEVTVSATCSKVSGNNYGCVIDPELGKRIHGQELLITYRQPQKP
jgi:hypothetical protein